MEKNLLITLSVILGIVLVGGYFLFSGGDTSSEEETSEAETGSAKDSVLERYTDFESELGCLLVEAGLEEDSNALLDAMMRTEEIATKHGFTEEEIVSLVEKYKDANNSEFIKLIEEKMGKQCPEALAMMQK